jgi:tellurite resistance protein TerC
VGTPVLWVGFLLGVLVMVFIDLRLSAGKPVSPKKAAAWTAVWVTLSLSFAGFLYSLGGKEAALPFLTAYVIEYGLSVDNLFVFLVVFSYFRVKKEAQHRLLYWGILGAFVMRGALIFVGTALVAKFSWLLYVFGAFLLYTAWKLLFSGGDEQMDPEQSRVLRWARKVLPVTTREHGLSFVTRAEGRLMVTPLFLVLVVVETTDLLFALDSIPAVLAISQDPFIVFSSNACAILGLRSLFFLVSSLMDKFRFLKVGLGLILAFVGVKLIAETAFVDWAHTHEALIIGVSLAFIGAALAVSILASVLVKPPADASASPPPSLPQAEVPGRSET